MGPLLDVLLQPVPLPPVISLLLPSRGRPAGVDRLVASVLATAAGEVELVVRLDDDDPALRDYGDHVGVRYLTGPRDGIAAGWNECYLHARGDVVMVAADDVVFGTPGWDSVVVDAFPDDGIAFVHGDDGDPHAVWFGTHGFLRREWVDAVGYVVPPWFSADYTDTWLNAVANVLERRVYRSIDTEHLHPNHGTAPLDETYMDARRRQLEDDPAALYYSAPMAARRVADAALLAPLMR